MAQANSRYLFDPQQLLPIPFTAISHAKKVLASKALSQPFMYEVYCPISCKKIKIGSSKERQHQVIEFNTTSSRTVSVYVNENIKYLVNQHLPTKKDRKKVGKDGWGLLVEVQQKGNIAILNPYCVLPNDPLSFYTLEKILPSKFPGPLPFTNWKAPEAKKINLSKVFNKFIYLSEDNNKICLNSNFNDNVSQQVTIIHPNNSQLAFRMSPTDAKDVINSHLFFWLDELKKCITIEQTSQQKLELQYNLDEIYENLGMILNLDEQLRAKLMTNKTHQLYQNLYKYHPRLYSAYSRLSSFLNYGNTHYDIVDLAQKGFYNKTDMLQNIAYFQFPGIPIETAEQQFTKSAEQLRKKLFPFARLANSLPFPNVPLKTTFEALHYQTISDHKIKMYNVEDSHIIFVDQKCQISVWNAETFPIKCFEFSYDLEYANETKALIMTDKQFSKKTMIIKPQAQQNDEQFLINLFQPSTSNMKNSGTNTNLAKQVIKPQDIKPDQAMLQQLIDMGYGVMLSKKALVKVKNQSIPVAIDAIVQLEQEQSKKLKKKKIKKEWSCPTCTLFNKADSLSCQACGQTPDFVEQQQQQRKRQLQQELLAKQQEKKKQEQKLRLQKEQKEKQEQRIKNEKIENAKRQAEKLRKCQLIGMKFVKMSDSPLAPYFVLVTLYDQEQNLTVLRCFRIAISPQYFVKFYQIQEEKLISNFNRQIFSKKTLEEFNQIAFNARNQIQFGLRLMTSYNPNDWYVCQAITIKETGRYDKIQFKSNFISVSGQQQSKVYKIVCKDTLQKFSFILQNANSEQFKNLAQIFHQQQVNMRQKSTNIIQMQNCQDYEIQAGVDDLTVKVIQHLPAGKFQFYQLPDAQKFQQVQTKNCTEIIMSQFIPLTIQTFEGSVFSWKHFSTSILENNNIYISNYPDVSFTFKSLSSKPFLAETVTIISTNKRLQKIYPMGSGLIFTANELSWFELAKKHFRNMNKNDYNNWVQKNKSHPSAYRNFWQPVGFFEVETQIQFQLDYKRTAKYIFLLPTGVRQQPDKITEVAAIKIDFFGVKGRQQQDTLQRTVLNKCSNDGTTGVLVDIQQKEEGNWKQMSISDVIISKATTINSYNLLKMNRKQYQNIPLSISTTFNIKIRDTQTAKKISIKSDYSRKILITTAKPQKPQLLVNQGQIKTFQQLLNIQSRVNNLELENIVINLDFSNFVLKYLQTTSQLTQYERLLFRLLEIPETKTRMFLAMSDILSHICDPSIPVSEVGFRSFLRVYDKICIIDSFRTFQAVVESLRNATKYVAANRNKNYTILRNKYKIQDMVLEPHLFSKNYYRLLHPNYVENEKSTTLTTEPTTPINHQMFLREIDGFGYQAILDLQNVLSIEKIDLYFPKNNTQNRYKFSIRIAKILSNRKQEQIYCRYFHEDFLNQMTINAFRDSHIFIDSENPANCFTILCENVETRFIKIDVRYVLLTTLQSLRYKEPTEKMHVLPLIRTKKVNKIQTFSQEFLNSIKEFPKQTKHNLIQEKMPHAKYAQQGNKYYYTIHELEKISYEESKTQFSQIIDKITTNIMDQSIVEKCVKEISINQYQFGKKGIDFAYNLVLNIIKLFSKMPDQSQYTVSVELMLALYDCFVVYQSGPIHKSVSAKLADLYKNLTNQQRSIYINSLIDTYISSIDKIKALRISEQYEVSKILDSLKIYKLPTGCLFEKLNKSKNKFLISCLLSALLNDIQNFGIDDHREVYDFKTGKYKRQLPIDEMMRISMQCCLWILENTNKITEEFLDRGLRLLLMFFPYTNQKNQKVTRRFHDVENFKKFMVSLTQQQLWKLVFLTLRLKNQDLSLKINCLFKTLVENRTENFQKSINNMLLEIIKKSEDSLYFKINQEVSNDLWMFHLQTILQYLNLTQTKMLLSRDTGLELLQLPLTPNLWSLSLQILPRENEILGSIIKNFPPELYAALGKQITIFCQPLAEIRPLQSIHINWLHLVRKIRIQGKNIFELFIEQLKESSFGGYDSLTMASVQQTKQLQITVQMLKLVLEQPLKAIYFTEKNLKTLIMWYFLNKTTQNGHSPATENLKYISDNMVKLFEKIAQIQEVLPLCIKIILQTKQQSQAIQNLFSEKRISSYQAIKLNQQFCKCFQELLNIFLINDELARYFVLDLNGIEYLLNKIGLRDHHIQTISSQQNSLVSSNSDQDYFIQTGLFIKKSDKVSPKQVSQILKKYTEIIPEDLKQQQFANNATLIQKANPHNLIISTKDWSTYKKGTKAKLGFLYMSGVTHQQYPLEIELGKACEVRSIKIGFQAASFDMADKLVVSPSSIIIEGGLDRNHIQPIGQMQLLQDEGYISGGVRVFVLNLQKSKKFNKISQTLKDFSYIRVKFLKIIIKRPIIAFIEGAYSTLNNRNYHNLGCNLSFVSVYGDDISKLPTQLFDACRQYSKKAALNILNNLIGQSNPNTSKLLAHNEIVTNAIKFHFQKIKQIMNIYPDIMPAILFSFGANDNELGDWLMNKFLQEGDGEIQAKLVNQIITSTPDKIYDRINIFQKNIVNKVKKINSESQIQSGILFVRDSNFMESFCKTLEQCYDIGFENGSVLECDKANIDELINIYDKKYSSPEIKSIIKILVSLIYIRQPLKLSENLRYYTLDLVWNNCSESKPYFYTLMSALLVNRKSRQWLIQQDRKKIIALLKQINKSIETGNQKMLKLQVFLLLPISYHQYQFLKQQYAHMNLYNQLKNLIYVDGQILEYLQTIIQNIVLTDEKQQAILSEQLVADVCLLVKRRDPILHKFYVNLLGLEKQVMVVMKNFNNNSKIDKKYNYIPSKLLGRNQQKSILEKINKKSKYNLLTEASQNKFKPEDSSAFLNALNNPPFLLLIRLKRQNQYLYCGVYNVARSVRSEQQSYQWEEVVNYQNGSFIFYIIGGEMKIIENDSGTLFANMISDEQSGQQAITFYDKQRQVIKISLTDSNQNYFTLQNADKKLFDNVCIDSYELWDVKHQQSSNDSKKMLNLTNKAKAPFIYYRHAPIYSFPAKIDGKKYIEMLGYYAEEDKKLFTVNGKPIDYSKTLEQLVQKTEDFIINIEINQNLSTKEDKNTGYIPKMFIFDKFSELGGVNEVLKIGSQAIKDWKKVQLKKNFEHYMQELKTFVHLPNFFNLFIKNHQSVTFLFEVAASLPDDANTTRNWVQEEAASSKFIYKIVADIFKYDRSLKLRDMNKYNDFCDIILQKLAQISKETVRQYKQEQQQPEKDSNNENIVLPSSVNKKPSQHKKKKKKGTGYGADNQNNSKWSSAQWLQNRKTVNQEILRIVNILGSFLTCEKPLTDERLGESIKQSCLLPLLENALRSGSLLDISKQSQLYKSYLQIIRSLVSNPATINCVQDLGKNYKPVQTESIHTLLHKLNNIAQIFSSCLKSDQSNSETEANQIAHQIGGDIQKTWIIIDRAVKNMKRTSKTISIKQINQLPIDKAYRILLGDLRFGYVSLQQNNVYSHAYNSSISGNNSSKKAKILRLSQQLADLSSSLPCEHTNSIFVRCDKSRIDVIKALVMGSKDTPYSNGAFMFDVFCEDSYPNNPPKMLLTTTGQGKIRFNPNLYACGKVCLSLLGTWRGVASQNWDPKLSTLLQLFISTQGITMSEDIYFNQPGFEGQQGTQQGDKRNQAYSNIVRLGNIRYAMIDQLKNPPKGFEEVIKRHFYVKKKQIIQEVQKWIHYADTKPASYSGLVSDQNSSWASELKSTKTKYKELLNKQFQELKRLLEELPEPNLKQKQQQLKFESKKQKKTIKAKEAKLQQIDVSYDKNSKENQLQEHVMQDRWSRYIGAMGVDAVKKQAESSVLLIGLSPLGLEIAKNLVLSGLKKLTIFDNTVVKNHHQHFYMSDLKGQKTKQCVHKIKQLNPYMVVEHLETMPAVKDYNFVVSTSNYQQSMEISKQCRKNNIKFINTQTIGTCGLYFADFGQKFEVNDKNGEQPFEGMIKNISSQEKGIVTLLDGVKHSYQDGDYIVLNKVRGMSIKEESIQQKSQAQVFFEQTTERKPQGINGRVFQIEVINWNQFKIGDTRNFTQYQGGGFCQNIKVPSKYDFKSYEECSEKFEDNLDSNFGIYDFEKMADNYFIFVCFQAYAKFLKKYSKAPKNWNQQDGKIFVEIAKEIAKQAKKQEQEINRLEKFAYQFALVSEAEMPTIGAYLGGLAAQEIIKGITNKFMPIKQFFTFHLNQLLVQLPQNAETLKNRVISEQEPFRSLKIIIGRQNAQKVQKMNTFIIGAGAIGCQLLKNFAMINMGSSGAITVTDPDHIETSNLTRQFLFRQKHVKKPKSATASATLVQMNPGLKGHISARLDKVCQTTEDIYNDDFFKKQTVIANALDNVKARVYVDKRCVLNKKPLFQSGTLGPKGHVQVIVPQKTENYGSQNDPEQENQIPHCTLKMFPQQTVHCIEWSRDIFGKKFTLDPKALKKIIDTKDPNSLQGQQRATVKKMIEFRPSNFDDCITSAVYSFFKHFRNNIRQLLHTYPLDMKTKEGKNFWELPKRPPKQVSVLDPKDQVICTYIASYAVLVAKIYSIPFPKDFRTAQGKQKIMKIAIDIKVPEFIPSEQKSKQLQAMQQKQQKSKSKEMSQQNPNEVIQQSSTQFQEAAVELNQEILEMKIMPQQFEKDQDSNGHIDLIYSMSNLRCRNYGISECKWIDAKLKAGKIMPALSTTTSVVSALQTLQILKYVVGSKTWRNAFVNLAVPMIQITEPGQAVKHKIGNTEFTVWDQWQLKANSLEDLIQQIRKKYDVQAYNISTFDGKPIYWQALYKEKQQARKILLSKPLKQMFNDEIIQLNISMRSNNQQKKNYDNVPRVKVQIC